MHDNWFEYVFLPSLYERVKGMGLASMWLTVNQTAVCQRNMEVHSSKVWNAEREYVNTRFYTCTWQGREVRLQYSSRNGCGSISFGQTAGELAEMQQRAEQAEWAQKVAEADKRRKWQTSDNPRLARAYESKRRQLQRDAEEYAIIAEEYAESGDLAEAECYRRHEAEARRELALYV